MPSLSSPRSGLDNSPAFGSSGLSSAPQTGFDTSDDSAAPGGPGVAYDDVYGSWAESSPDFYGDRYGTFAQPGRPQPAPLPAGSTDRTDSFLSAMRSPQVSALSSKNQATLKRITRLARSEGINDDVPVPEVHPDETISDRAHQGRLKRLHQLAAEHIAATENLDQPTRQRYYAALSGVLARLPKGAVHHVHRSLKGFKFHPTVRHLNEALRADYPQHFADRPNEKSTIVGAFTRDGKIYANGLEFFEGKKVDESHVHAHELGHAIDGWDNRHSLSLSWWMAWGHEMASGQLSNYAAGHPSEGFAEFARLLYGNNTLPLAEVEQRFPKASSYWKSHGLWPSTKENDQ
jgi:hypothetical protein